MSRIKLGVVAVFASACTGDIAVDGSGGGGGSGSGSNPGSPDVQVVVRDGLSPQSGVRVLFQDGSGNVLADTMTDATGSAQFAMPTGDVTVIRTYAPVNAVQRPDEVYTFVGAKAGDVLALGNAAAQSVTPGAIVVDVSNGAQGTVSVKTPCGSGQGTAPNIAITVTNCPAMVDFFVTDGNNSSFYAKMQYAPNVDLTSQTFAGELTSSLAAIDVPPNTTVNADELLVAGLYTLFDTGSKRIDQQLASVNLPSVTGLDRLVVATVDTNNSGRQEIATRAPYSPSPTSVDVQPNLVPYVTAAAWTTAGVTWTETGAGSADAVISTLDVTPRGAVSTAYYRVLVAPHAGSAMLAIPSVPGTTYNAVATDQVNVEVGIVKSTGGYDSFRASTFSVDDVASAAPANGTLTIAYSGQNAPGRIVAP